MEICNHREALLLNKITKKIIISDKNYKYETIFVRYSEVVSSNLVASNDQSNLPEKLQTNMNIYRWLGKAIYKITMQGSPPNFCLAHQ